MSASMSGAPTGHGEACKHDQSPAVCNLQRNCPVIWSQAPIRLAFREFPLPSHRSQAIGVRPAHTVATCIHLLIETVPTASTEAHTKPTSAELRYEAIVISAVAASHTSQVSPPPRPHLRRGFRSYGAAAGFAQEQHAQCIAGARSAQHSGGMAGHRPGRMFQFGQVLPCSRHCQISQSARQGLCPRSCAAFLHANRVCAAAWLRLACFLMSARVCLRQPVTVLPVLLLAAMPHSC